MATTLHPPIDGSVLEGLSKTLGDTNKGLTGPEIAKFLQEVGIQDVDSGITKWKRLYNAFAHYQNEKQHSNNILGFITKSINPARFIGRNEQFEDLRFELNKRLSFIGLQLSERGKFSLTTTSTTISEAEQKANRFKSKLQQRNVHDNIYEFCKAELLAENYFHSVFEATKSIAETIRQRTELTQDGSELIDIAFSTRNPLIRINDFYRNKTKRT